MSIAQFDPMTLPDFVVITGANGAGKSQLLQAIYQQAIIGSWGGSQQDIRYLTSEQLGAPQEFQGGTETRESQVARFETVVRNMNGIRSQSPYDTPEGIRNAVHDQLRGQGLSDETIFELESRSPRPLIDWTHDEFVEHTPIDFGGIDLFSIQVGDLFSRYSQLLTANDLNRFLASENQPVVFKNDEDFAHEFGRPPWDLFNGALERVGLRYRFETPPRSMVPLPSPPALVDSIAGTRLSVSMLSTGEKALLSVAMSVYSVENRRGFMRMPRIVLLDEPDASLHPSMIRSLISLLSESFVRDLGIPVIMTTHSPTTVALAPDESVYVMYKDQNPRLAQAESRDHALAHLLVGVPTLSVSAENRRVVIVESTHDEHRYTTAAALLRGSLASERSLVFMAAGGGAGTNGSAAVIDLVSRLRDNGNVLVWGLVDRDDRATEPDSHVYMNSERYTAENFFLDPLSVGLLLLHEAHQPTLQALSPTTYLAFDHLVHSQQVANYVLNVLADADDDATLERVPYEGGFSLELPKFWLDEKGHVLAARVFDRFRELSVFRDENRLMSAILDRVWSDRTAVIPLSISQTLRRLLS